jgi:hypothetical protein
VALVGTAMFLEATEARERKEKKQAMTMPIYFLEEV